MAASGNDLVGPLQNLAVDDDGRRDQDGSNGTTDWNDSDIKQYLHSLAKEICDKKEVNVDKIIGHFRKINIPGDPTRIEMKDLMKIDPVTSALSYIFAASMHRRVKEPKLQDARYCFFRMSMAIDEFQKVQHQKLLKNDATTESVTDILIVLMIKMYQAEFGKIQEEEDKDLNKNENAEAIAYAAAWITEACLHLRWKKEADQFYEIGLRFGKVTENFEDLTRLYNSRAKYLAMIGYPQEHVNSFFKLAEDTAKKMAESDSKTEKKLLRIINVSRKQCDRKYAGKRN